MAEMLPSRGEADRSERVRTCSNVAYMDGASPANTVRVGLESKTCPRSSVRQLNSNPHCDIAVPQPSITAITLNPKP